MKTSFNVKTLETWPKETRTPETGPEVREVVLRAWWVKKKDEQSNNKTPRHRKVTTHQAVHHACKEHRSGWRQDEDGCRSFYISLTVHVWRIYLRWGGFIGQCRYIYIYMFQCHGVFGYCWIMTCHTQRDDSPETKWCQFPDHSWDWDSYMQAGSQMGYQNRETSQFDPLEEGK